MDKKSINIPKNIEQQGLKTNNPNVLKNGSNISAIKVPKKEVVVSDNSKTNKASDRKLQQQLDKQKRESEKAKLKEQQKEERQKQQLEQKEKTQNKEQLKAEKQKEKEQRKLEQKKEKLEEIERKQKEKEILSRQKVKEKQQKQKQEKKDYGLNDLDELENRLLRRKETEEQRKKRILIIILSTLLTAMMVIGSFTVRDIIEDQKPKPVAVKIEIEVEGLEKELIDPNNPDLGYIKKIVYPGDTFDVNFYVYNNAVTNNFPVYLRFRAYIELEELSEHSVFELHFENEESWYTLKDENGLELDIDDWYYYGGSLPTGQESKIQTINALTIRTDLGNYFQGKDFTLILQIQAIQGSREAATEIFEEWFLAPEEWIEHMELNGWYEHLIPVEEE